VDYPDDLGGALRGGTPDGGGAYHLSGELDLAARRHLPPRIAALGGGAADVVVIDLSAVTFIDSTGLATLVGVQRSLEESGGGLLLRAPGPTVSRMLALAALDELVEPPR